MNFYSNFISLFCLFSFSVCWLLFFCSFDSIIDDKHSSIILIKYLLMMMEQVWNWKNIYMNEIKATISLHISFILYFSMMIYICGLPLKSTKSNNFFFFLFFFNHLRFYILISRTVFTIIESSWIINRFGLKIRLWC